MIHLELYKHRKVQALSADFSTFFPDLLLCLYYKPAAPHDQAKHAHLRHTKLAKGPKDLIEDCTASNNEGLFVFDPALTIKDFRAQLLLDYGIHSEVFQRVGKNQWSTFSAPEDHVLNEVPFLLH
jgi:hypothetical protein